MLSVAKTGRRGVTPGYSRNPRVAASMRVHTIASILLFELHNAYFHVGSSLLLRQVMGVAMGSKGGPVLAWCVCMMNEHRFHATLGVDSRYIRVFCYFDDVWQLLLVPRGIDGDAWVAKQVAALKSDCYPASLRLLQNSQGSEADMLACWTAVIGGQLVCVHRSKNAQFLQRGERPRFANFVPYASAHAKRSVVVKNSVLGLLHRMHMDTLACDVHRLLPVLLSYNAELGFVGYPRLFLTRLSLTGVGEAARPPSSARCCCHPLALPGRRRPHERLARPGGDRGRGGSAGVGGGRLRSRRLRNFCRDPRIPHPPTASLAAAGHRSGWALVSCPLTPFSFSVPWAARR